MTYQLEKDLPITKKEDDILDREKFAECLTAAIINYTNKEKNTDGLVIGLEGEWGSGKTSLLNLMKAELGNRVILRTFNSWLATDQTSLVTEFFKTIISASSENDVFGKEDMKKYGKSFLINMARSFSIGIPVTGITFSPGKLIDSYISEKTLSEQKKSIFDSLIKKKSGKWLVLFVDDIDRLSYDEVGILFQLIKNVADFPKVIYVLAYDKEVVINALNRVQQGKGEEYLQKVIQVTYDVPVPEGNLLEEYFLQRLNSIVNGRESYRLDQEHFQWIYPCIREYIKNIRDCNRICNAFSMKYLLCGEECDVGDLLAITVIELYEANIFENLKNHKFYMLGKDNHGLMGTDTKLIKEFASQLFNKANPKKKDTIINLICNMFPRFYECIEMHDVMTSGAGESNSDKIGSEEGFDKYFALSIKKSEVPINEVINFLNLEDKTEILTQLEFWNDNDQLRYVFKRVNDIFRNKEWLKQSGDRFNKAKVKIFLEALSGIKLEEQEQYGIFSVSNSTLRDFFIRHLLGQGIEDKKTQQWDFEALDNIFRDKEISLSILSQVLISASAGYDWIYGSQTLKTLKSVVNKSDFDKLVDTFLHRVKAAAKDDSILNEEKSALLLYFWKQMESESYQSFIKGYKDQLGLISRLNIFVQVSTVNGNMNDKIYRLEKSAQEDFDLEECTEKVKSFLMTAEFKNLNQKIKESIVAFLLIYEKLQQSKEPIGDISNISVDIEEVNKYLSEL